MLNFSKTRIAASVERAVASPLLITAEGLPLIADASLANGVATSAGGGSEVFVGVSYSQQKSILGSSTVAEVTVASDGTFTLPYPRSSATNCRFVIVTNGVEGSALALTPASAGSPTATETEAVTQQTFKTNASNAGKTIRAYFRFAPTAVQAQMLQGDVHPGGDASYILNTVTVITKGDVYTDQYDPSADWSAGGSLRVSTTGLFTNTGSGAVIPGARIIERPTAAQPFLGISIGFNG